MGNNPISFNDPLGDIIRHGFRTGFLGIFGKKVTLTYDTDNKRWNNKVNGVVNGGILNKDGSTAEPPVGLFFSKYELA